MISFGPEALDGALSWISCDITGVTGGYAARPLRIKSRYCGPLCAKSCRCPGWVKMRRTHYEQMLSELQPNNGHRTSASPAHQIRDSCHRWITEQHGQQPNQTAVPATAMCRANLQRPVAQSIYSRRRSTDQFGAGLFATARTLLVLSASLTSFASRLFFGALSTCLRLRPRSTNEGLVIWCGLIVSLALFMFIRRSRWSRNGAFVVPPRKTSRKCACTQPPATDGTSLAVNGWLEGSSSHLSSPWRMPTLAASTR